MTNSFVQDALKTVGSPQILVNMVSKRVRQLGQGYRPLIEVQPRWSFMEIALKEISDGKLSFIPVEIPEEKPEAKKTRRRRAA